MDAYWSDVLSGHAIRSEARMSAVFTVLADELELWAPPESAASLSRLTLQEAAHRLRLCTPLPYRP